MLISLLLLGGLLLGGILTSLAENLESELDEELRAHIEMATDGAGGLLSIRGDVTYKSQPTTRYPDFTRGSETLGLSRNH